MSIDTSKMELPDDDEFLNIEDDDVKPEVPKQESNITPEEQDALKSSTFIFSVFATIEEYLENRETIDSILIRDLVGQLEIEDHSFLLNMTEGESKNNIAILSRLREIAYEMSKEPLEKLRNDINNRITRLIPLMESITPGRSESITDLHAFLSGRTCNMLMEDDGLVDVIAVPVTKASATLYALNLFSHEMEVIEDIIVRIMNMGDATITDVVGYLSLIYDKVEEGRELAKEEHLIDGNLVLTPNDGRELLDRYRKLDSLEHTALTVHELFDNLRILEKIKKMFLTNL